MKTPPLALLNSLGFSNFAQQALYAASLLKAATLSSPQIQVAAAVPAVVGRHPRVALDAIAAFPAQTAQQNTAGIAAGVARPPRAGYGAIPASGGYAAAAAIPAITASPAYPAGTAIPAYPAIPAVAAIGEILPVAAQAAVIAPAVVALPGASDAITISQDNAGVVQIDAVLPVANSPALVGSIFEKVLEITPPALTVTQWVGTKASLVPTNITTLPATLEETFLQWAALALAGSLDAGSITDGIHTFNGVAQKVKVISLKVQSNADPTEPVLKLPTVGYYSSAGNGSGGGGSSPP